MQRKHVILFARTPRYGRVKTRLARDIGKTETLRFYRNTLTNVSKRLMRHKKFDFSVALTPDIDLGRDAGPLFNSLRLRKQGAGDLGRRMSSVFASLPPGPAIIIGSDIPDIEPRHLERAFMALGKSDAVFGPCDDGGYWLVGLKQLCAAPPDFMNKVRWSSPDTLKDTIATLPKHWHISYTDSLNDIDDGQAFRKWKKNAK